MRGIGRSTVTRVQWDRGYRSLGQWRKAEATAKRALAARDRVATDAPVRATRSTSATAIDARKRVGATVSRWDALVDVERTREGTLPTPATDVQACGDRVAMLTELLRKCVADHGFAGSTSEQYLRRKLADALDALAAAQTS